MSISSAGTTFASPSDFLPSVPSSLAPSSFSMASSIGSFSVLPAGAWLSKAASRRSTFLSRASKNAASFAGTVPAFSFFSSAGVPPLPSSSSRAAAASMAICSISSGLLPLAACPKRLKSNPCFFMVFLSGRFPAFSLLIVSESKIAARFPALPRSTTAM